VHYIILINDKFFYICTNKKLNLCYLVIISYYLNAMYASQNCINEFVDNAIVEAHKSPLHQKHGCVIVYNGNIIGKGFNKYRKSGYGYRRGKINGSRTLHAEICAIMDAFKNYSMKQWKKIIEKCVLIVVRLPTKYKDINEVTKHECMSSAPCVNCERTIKRMNIPIVIHS